jgi:Holliday junction resolvasome RuvABC endonuclease subunit
VPAGELSERLKIILDGLMDVITSCRPEQVALE